jgi:outer membrane receptor for ferrienterochelin and colicins
MQLSRPVRSLPCWPVVLSLLLAAPAAADNTADEADVAFNLGNAAYAKKDYERAMLKSTLRLGTSRLLSR